MKYIDKAVESIKVAYVSHTPIVWIVTPTIESANKIAISFANEHFGGIRSVKNIGEPKGYVFDSISGYRANNVSNKITPQIYFSWQDIINEEELKNLKKIFKEFIGLHQSLEIEAAARSVIDESHQQVFFQSMIIIASPLTPELGWLNRYINVIYVGVLEDVEIEEIINHFIKCHDIKISDSFTEQLIVNFRGVSEREIDEVLTKCLVSEYFDFNYSDSRNKILQEIRYLKRQMLDGFNGLKWIPIDKYSSNASGLDAITKWLEERKNIFSDPERKQKEGFDVPKGILVTGIPGTGKSLMAKETARILNLPLIAMDLGDLQEGIVGKSEEHMATALRMVDAMAPCVLWIDEIEKAFSGANSGQSDGGVMRRMFGKFLTWMQEKQSFCFVFATSNDISKLPPELFRSERFDEKFYNFMPSVNECADIFVSCIKNHNDKYRINNSNTALLFDKELESVNYWIEFLNDAMRLQGKVSLTEEGYWEDGIMPVRKLFTGADISAFVKLLKFEILSHREQNYMKPITKLEMQNARKEVLIDFMPYGETNLNDIAICFINLSNNRFKSASNLNQKDLIVCFDDFKQESATIAYNPQKFSDSPYNQALYRCVVGSVNSLYLKKMHNSHTHED